MQSIVESDVKHTWRAAHVLNNNVRVRHLIYSTSLRPVRREAVQLQVTKRWRIWLTQIRTALFTRKGISASVWMVSSPSAALLLQQRRYFSFIVGKSSVTPTRCQIIYCVGSAAFVQCHLPKSLVKTTARRLKVKNVSVEPFYSTWELWSFTCKRPLAEIYSRPVTYSVAIITKPERSRINAIYLSLIC